MTPAELEPSAEDTRRLLQAIDDELARMEWLLDELDRYGLLRRR